MAAKLGAEIQGLSSADMERHLSPDEPLDDIGRAVVKSTEKVRLYEKAVRQKNSFGQLGPNNVILGPM